MGGRISFQLKPTEQFLVRSKDSLSEYVTRCSECSRTPSAAAACVSMFLKPFQTLGKLFLIFNTLSVMVVIDPIP
jgi:hypothetical protein